MIVLIYLVFLALTYTFIGEDKAMHMLASSLLVCLGYQFFRVEVLKVMSAVLVVGFFKEVFDYSDYGVFSLLDMLANLFGVFGALCFYNLTYLKDWWDYIFFGHIKH